MCRRAIEVEDLRTALETFSADTRMWFSLTRQPSGGKMAKNSNMTVALGDHFGTFVDQLVREARYGSASDVVRAGLRLLEVSEMKREALRAALVQGEMSGAAMPFDVEEYLITRSKPRRASRRPEDDDEIPF
jgi:antitoxin ParD1/3/4